MPVRRRLLFVAIMLCVIGVCVEVGGALTWRFMTGEWFTWSVAAGMRDLASGRVDGVSASGAAQQVAAEQAAAQQAANSGRVLNPFLGYVYRHGGTHQSGFDISNYGFVDTDSPLQTRGEDRYVVALVGGSVALQLGLYAGDVLAAELEKSAALRGRQVHVVRMGLGGWKQPQQLFAMQLAWLRGGEFDAVINLDGFNEVAMVAANVRSGVPAWFPRGWGRLMDDRPSREQQLRLGRLALLLEQRVVAAQSAGSVSWSPTLQTLWLTRDRRMATQLSALREAIDKDDSTFNQAATGPGVEGRDVEASRREMVDVWRRASIELGTLCEQHGARYFHFLQPNQYVPGAKVMRTEERLVAFEEREERDSMRAAVLHGYPLLQAASRELVASGVDYTDLTMVYRDHKEPLYVDKCCHVGKRGNEILAVSIASHIRAKLDLDGFVAEKLSASAATLQLESPVAAVPLGVVAVDVAGREVDVSAKGFGTEFSVEPAGALIVGDNGAVRAVRRGNAQVRVKYGRHELLVPVVASWPDEFVVPDGWAADGVDVPALRLHSGETAKFGCIGLPADGFRILAASSRPLPSEIAPGDAFGVTTKVLAGTASSLTAQMAAPTVPGAPLFLRLYIINVAGKVAATSNLLVVTRG
ncbi:MAG: hypothetical protein ACI89X_003952 [Planctomycetota bacterium]|jgi:hypothetical protein